MLDFRIQTFLSVCKTMNFTRAAEELHITQPAVSQHIRYLENLYQVSLFSHSGKKIELTPAGEILLSTAAILKNDEHFMIEQMQHTTTGDISLVFGVTMTIGEYIIARPIARYLKNHPNADLHIALANTHELLNRLHDGDIGFALVEGYFDANEYDTLLYRTESFIPVCAANHKFHSQSPKCDSSAQPSSFALQDLLAERLLVREPGSGTRNILERNLAVSNIQITDFAHTAEIDSMHTIVKLLLEDCGISFLYKTAVEEELSAGLLYEIPLKDFRMTHNFTFIWNKNSIFAGYYQNICRELAAPCP